MPQFVFDQTPSESATHALVTDGPCRGYEVIEVLRYLRHAAGDLAVVLVQPPGRPVLGVYTCIALSLLQTVQVRA